MNPYRIDANQEHSYRYRLSPVEGRNLDTKIHQTF
jgi:hypothetical protein